MVSIVFIIVKIERLIAYASTASYLRVYVKTKMMRNNWNLPLWHFLR